MWAATGTTARMRACSTSTATTARPTRTATSALDTFFFSTFCAGSPTPHGENFRNRTQLSRLSWARTAAKRKKEMNYPVMPKRVGYLYDKMLDKDLIRFVILDSARHKYRRREVRKVLTHLEKYVERTYKILSEGSYVPTRPKLKTIYDNSSQKQRELKIVPFWPDGIVHRLLVEAMKPVLMRGMHPYSCASIPGRGGARIRNYIAHAMRHDLKGTKYACEMDICHFYPSVQARRLIRALGRKIKDKRFLRLIWAILKSCGQGLAIGYYICQWLANFYLEKLDWMLARMPGVKYYTRYMDNITMLGPNKRMLHRARVAAEKFLRDELGLAVKENWQVYRTTVARKAKGRPRAVSAVGFRFWHGFTTLRRRNFLRMLRQARRIQKKQKMGIPVSVQQAAGFLSRAGQLNHCNSFRVKEKYIRSIKIKRLKEVIRNESKRQCKAGWALYGRTPPATA